MTNARERLAEARDLFEQIASTEIAMRAADFERRGEQRIPCFIQVETVYTIRAWLAHDDEGRNNESKD